MTRDWVTWATLVGGALSVVAWAGAQLQRSRGAAERWAWMAAIVLGVVIPAAMAVRPRVVQAGPPITLTALPVATALPAAAEPRAPVALYLWGSATAAMLLVVGGSLWSLHRARRVARRDRWEGAEVAVTAHLGPGAAPFGAPAILVPAWTSALSAHDRRLLLQHEQSHVEARDARWLLAATLLVALVPWNLPLWWCLRRLRTAIELDCDARVLASGAPRRAYAELLLGVAAHPARRLAPALLAFAPSPTQLRIRIDAMTTISHLTPLRRSMLGLAALAAVVVACEARLPEPVAPVTDYVVKDGEAKAIILSSEQGDSARKSLAAVLEERPQGSVGDEDLSKPLIVVYDAGSRVVYSGRGQEADQRMKGAAADMIASVEVMKRGDLLPPEARAGLITVRLKPGASWPGAVADSASGVRYKSPAVAPRGDAPRIVIGQLKAGAERRSEAPGIQVEGRPLQEPATMPRTASPGAIAGEPLVKLIDGDGKVLYEGRGAMRGDQVGPYLLDPSLIERAEVNKTIPGGAILIYLKPGSVPKKAP